MVTLLRTGLRQLQVTKFGCPWPQRGRGLAVRGTEFYRVVRVPEECCHHIL